MGKRSRNRTRSPQSQPQVNNTSTLDTDIQQVFAHALELHQQGNYSEAANLYKVILENKPDHSDSLHSLGLIAYQNGSFDAAIDLIKRAIETNARVGEYHYNLATIYKEAKQNTAALKHYKKTIRLQPKNTQAYENMGVIFHELEEVSAARKSYLDALKINPSSLAALGNMGSLLNDAGRYDEAEKYFDKAILCSPMDAEIRFKRSHVQLLRGEFEKGWKNYQWMFFAPSFIGRNIDRLVPFPKWDGSNLAGKRLLINLDQGIGDELMFASCLPDIIKQAESVVIECDARLTSLYQQSFPSIDILPIEKRRNFHWHKNLGKIDYKVNLSGLAQFFRRSEEDFPAHEGYINADSAKISEWKQRLLALSSDSNRRLNIGISWQGGGNERATKIRSIPLTFWKELCALPDVNIINLQYGDHDKAIAEFNQQNNNALKVFNELDPLKDLDGFSALIAALDLVISIDNSTVHFAGALGTPTWAIVAHTPDWRWMLNRQDSPWYPSLKLYRAEKMGADSLKAQLKAVVKDLSQALKNNSLQRDHVTPARKTDNSSHILNISEQHPYALLLNDTSAWADWGHSCSSLAIHKKLRERYDSVASLPTTATLQLFPFPDSVEQFDDPAFFEQFSSAHPRIIEKLRLADAIFINGQDLLQGLNQSSLSLLYLAYIAKTKLARPVTLFNHSGYPDGVESKPHSPAYAIYQKVYQSLDSVMTREILSSEEINKMDVKALQSFDCLPLFIESSYQQHSTASQNDIIITASSTWDDHIITEIKRLVKQLHQHGLKPKLLIGASAKVSAHDINFVQALKGTLGKFCSLKVAFNEQEWLAAIDQAQMLITGSFHHSIAAAFLNTPFLVTGKHNLEINGLLQMLELNNFISADEENLATCLYNKTLALIENPEEAQIDETLKKKCLALALNNFSNNS